MIGRGSAGKKYLHYDFNSRFIVQTIGSKKIRIRNYCGISAIILACKTNILYSTSNEYDLFEFKALLQFIYAKWDEQKSDNKKKQYVSDFGRAPITI